MINLKNKFLTIFVTGFLVGPMSANASLIGADVNQSWYYPDTSSFYCDSGNATVGAGIEFTDCGGYQPNSTDVTASQLIVTSSSLFSSGSGFNGFLLSIISGPAIVSASYAGGTMDVTSLLVDTSGLWVNFEGNSSGGVAYIDYFTASSNVVPAPATLALFGLGLAGLGWSRRKKA